MMLRINKAPHTTAVKYIADLYYEPKSIVMKLAKTQITTTIFIFSDTIKNRNGTNLAKFIKDNKLGDIAESPTTTNGNSGNKIKTWIWSVHTGALKKWKKLNHGITT